MTEKSEVHIQLSSFERQIAAKMALDIRYFCADSAKAKSVYCTQPVTQLPSELADMITKTNIGSIVLFAENLASTKQVIELTSALQSAAMESESKQPLIISIDQEGGRVVRLPQATSFAGNMAIGATYLAKGTQFATQTSTVIAKELTLLGINNNYAPVVDVNTNALNPVINTRSYGEDATRVAKLGAAAVNGFQSQGIMATLKHFPGHGDTHVDSHLGLPLVEHELSTIEQKDLAPFRWAIEHSDPAMIMTAHIQYPALDNSTVENNKGEHIIRPATMSRKILTKLLRQKMGFDGIIATDALDMAGIAHYFDPVNAVVETFIAGADLAVMPFKIRTPEDIEQFYLFIKAVADKIQQKIRNGEFSKTEVSQSIARINHYKNKYITLPNKMLTAQIAIAQQQIAQKQYLQLEQMLADNAVVLLKNQHGNQQSHLPINISQIKRLHLYVLSWQEFRALKAEIKSFWQKKGDFIPQISATVYTEHYASQQADKITKADLIIATVDTKIASVVDLGGAEDIHSPAYMSKIQNKLSYEQGLTHQLQQAKKSNVASVLIVKGSPYLLQSYMDLVDSILLTFDDRIYQKDPDTVYSPGYHTSIAIIFGQQIALGKLPVTLPAE